jgi:hypothetical protein
MNPSETDMYPQQALEYKARVLEENGFDIYVDDDDCLRRRLQPLTRARCISTQDFYTTVGKMRLR